MLHFLSEIYLTAFTLFFRAGGADWPRPINAGKGVAGIAMIEWLFLLSVWGGIDVYIQKNTLVGFSQLIVFAAFFGLCFANHYPLVILGRGTLFEREFGKLKKARRVRLLIGFSVVLLAIVAFFAWITSMHLKLIHQANAIHQP